MSLTSTEVEIVPPNAVESISRAEIDVAIATARKFPRKLHAVKLAMMSFATLDEETAQSCFYTLPRGGKNIQGPSVRLAEIALSCYGNIRAGTRIIQTVATGDNPHVVIQSVAMDLENNVSITIEKRRRIIGKRNPAGGNYPPSDDDINLAANAGSAVAFRDAVFKVVPLALIKPVFDAARKVAIGDIKTLADRRAKCIETFTKMGVTKDKVLAKLELKSVEEVTLDHLETLIGLHNAIKEGELSIDEAFKTAAESKKADLSDLPPTGTAKAPATAPTTQANAVPSAAPASAGGQKPAETAETTSKAPEGQPDGDLGPVCAHCGQPMVENHMCEGLKAAIEKAQGQPAGSPAAQEAAEQQERKDLIDSISLILEQNGVTLPQLLIFCDKNKILKPKQKLQDASTSKLKTINKALGNPATVAELKGTPTPT